MRIVFPMAGASSRFFKAGYTQPKYMLDLAGSSVFARVVGGFEAYFECADFLFIYRNVQNTKDFIKQECERLGLKNYKAIELEKQTLGQAHTVMLGLEGLSDAEELLIFNIDTLRMKFSLPHFDFSKLDGYLEVFEGEGEHWSFVLPSEGNRVAWTSEKERISNLCSTGLYYFKRAGDFREIFAKMQDENKLTKGEFFIAPMYNELIERGGVVNYALISEDEVRFCGTPAEYEDLKRKMNGF